MLSLCHAAGTRYGRNPFDGIAQDRSERSAGVTLYPRAPASGLWKDSPGKSASDDIAVCDVMVETLEPIWWKYYRIRPERTFVQDELVVRSQEIERL